MKSNSKKRLGPKETREFLSGLQWPKTPEQLQKLKADLDHEAQFLPVIIEVMPGHHVETGLRFLADVAYGPNGEEILPDENGIFWWQDQGYMVAPSESPDSEQGSS